jgi:hypothetical protein
MAHHYHHHQPQQVSLNSSENENHNDLRTLATKSSPKLFLPATPPPPPPPPSLLSNTTLSTQKKEIEDTVDSVSTIIKNFNQKGDNLPKPSISLTNVDAPSSFTKKPKSDEIKKEELKDSSLSKELMSPNTPIRSEVPEYDQRTKQKQTGENAVVDDRSSLLFLPKQNESTSGSSKEKLNVIDTQIKKERTEPEQSNQISIQNLLNSEKPKYDLFIK